MRSVLAVCTAAVALGCAASPAAATTRVGIFAIVDEVVLEPTAYEPERARISGVFTVPQPHSSGRHLAPQAGHLYFSLHPSAVEATRRDWAALAEASGTGRPVGFARYWVYSDETGTNSSLRVRVHEPWAAAEPVPYPRPSDEGVVTRFDTEADTCPRFGRPSRDILADLREAYALHGRRDLTAAAGAAGDLPACTKWQGFIPSSELESAFAEQDRAPAWAGAVEAEILGRVARLAGLELTELAVECRRRVCRLRFVFPTPADRERGMSLLAGLLDELPELAEGGKVVAPRDGVPSLEYYVQRGRPVAAEAASP